MRPPRDERAVLNGLDHRLTVWDPEPGAPPGTLILLHGWLDFSRSFEPMVAAWPGPLPRTVAPDLRGHGESAWIGPEAYYHFADYVADLHALVRQLGEDAHREGRASTPRPRPPGPASAAPDAGDLARVTPGGLPADTEAAAPLYLAGHSMGGTVAALFTGAFPGRVAALALVEGMGPPVDPTPFPDRLARWIREVDEVRSRPRRSMPSVETAAARLRQANPRLPAEEALRLARLSTRPHAGGVVWSFDPRHRTRSPVPFSAAGFRECLGRIDCRVLLVEGAESGFHAPDLAERKAALRHPPREVQIPGAGHMVHQDQPAALAAALAAFFFG